MVSNQEPTAEVRWGDVLAGILLVAALLVAGARLIATDWVEGLDILPIIVFFGAAAGLALGYSRFSGRIAFLFALVYGIFTVFWRLGASMSHTIPWNERVFSILGRLESTITAVVRGQDVNDQILFLTAMAFLFWFLCVHAGYSLFRHGDAWSAILPAGAAMFVIHINDKFWPFRAWYLGIYLVLSLLLIARVAYLRLRLKWQKNHTRTPTYIGLDLSRAALIAVVPLILVAWTAPAVAMAFPSAQDTWQEFSQPVRNRLDHVFASLKATVGIVGDYYSDTLSLGLGNELSDAVVLTVDAPTIIPAGVRYYWKARTYDHYSSIGWTSTLDSTEPISPDIFNQTLADSPYRWDATLTFQSVIPLRTLHTVSETYSVSRPGEAIAAVNSDGSVDIEALQADPYLRSGEQYEIKAALTNVSVADLRETTAIYPDWVSQRYLELPDNITERTRELAKNIVEGQSTQYDKVEAITAFLRNNIEYTNRIDNPPNNQERVDWLLFDYRKGFCNYYATAEVVMLRTLGIPARIAVGYAQGERQVKPGEGIVPQIQRDFTEGDTQVQTSDTSQYIVRQKDLHAWPEVYFAGIGWVEFEPTASQLPLFRPIGDALLNDNSGALDQQSNDPLANDIQSQQDTSNLLPDLPVITPQQRVLQSVLRVGAVIGASALLGLALWGIRRRLPPEPIPVQLESRMRHMGIKPPRFLVDWARRAALPPLTKAYMEINHALRRLGKAPTPADTPSERVTHLEHLLPAASEPATYLLQEYQAQIYSPRQSNGEANAKQAGRQIRSLSLWAWFNRLISRWQEPKSKRQS
jgi:transglutaminase-like putative cysteine protease/predicted transporter